MAGPETSAPTPSRRSGPLLFRKKAGRRLETVGRLIERVRSNKDDRAPLNYIQALGLAADHRATEVIRPYYDKLSKAMEKEAALGIPDDIFWGRSRTLSSSASPETYSGLRAPGNAKKLSVGISIIPSNR
jgi:hypothetical protein